jgi:mannose-6-phosphate isomerase-like protein (cupin superfamily)
MFQYFLVKRAYESLYTINYLLNYMKGFTTNIEEATLENGNFRKVLYTSKHSQLVLMSLKPGKKLGWKFMKKTTRFSVLRGHGKCTIDGNEYEVGDGIAVEVPAGAQHNIINTSKTDDLKLYTIYSPAHQKDGII